MVLLLYRIFSSLDFSYHAYSCSKFVTDSVVLCSVFFLFIFAFEWKSCAGCSLGEYETVRLQAVVWASITNSGSKITKNNYPNCIWIGTWSCIFVIVTAAVLSPYFLCECVFDYTFFIFCFHFSSFLCFSIHLNTTHIHIYIFFSSSKVYLIIEYKSNLR